MLNEGRAPLGKAAGVPSHLPGKASAVRFLSPGLPFCHANGSECSLCIRRCPKY